MVGGEHVFVASDHAGFEVKIDLLRKLAKSFPEKQFIDEGCNSVERCHYPDYAQKVAAAVGRGEGKGILICGSGLGMCIVANKINGVRATSAWSVESARLSRQHNDSNIICLGARLIEFSLLEEICTVWLKTSFQGGRHQERIDLIQRIEASR